MVRRPSLGLRVGKSGTAKQAIRKSKVHNKYILCEAANKHELLVTAPSPLKVVPPGGTISRPIFQSYPPVFFYCSTAGASVIAHVMHTLLLPILLLYLVLDFLFLLGPTLVTERPPSDSDINLLYPI